MKKSKKVLLISLSVALALLVAVVAVSAFTMTNESAEILKYIAGVSDECPENADVNGDGKVNVLDVIAMIRELQTAAVRLETLSLDDENYSFVIKPKLRNSQKAKTLEDIVLKPKSTTVVKVKLKDYSDFDLSSLTAIDIVFDIFGMENTPKTIYIGNVYTTIK